MRKRVPLLLLPLLLSANDGIIREIDNALKQLQIESAKKVSKKVHIHYDPFFAAAPSAHKTVRPRIQPVRKRSARRPVLSMILNKTAFIDGRWVKEKEKIADYRVMKINKDSVVLKRKNKIITLKLPVDRHLLVSKEEK